MRGELHGEVVAKPCGAPKGALQLMNEGRGCHGVLHIEVGVGNSAATRCPVLLPAHVTAYLPPAPF